MPDRSDTSMGTISLIFGILGCVQILPCIGPVIALITGYAAKGTAGASNGRIGRILGWLMICFPIIAFIIYVILVFAVFNGSWLLEQLPT